MFAHALTCVLHTHSLFVLQFTVHFNTAIKPVQVLRSNYKNKSDFKNM